ncbi:hypothetical protein OPV22_001580 [Ensete ventricosum]|uniref:Serpin domain-containing protein n=1 Tax=Ensete ventricosum TaxID=4639 RepID=A0AAV8QCP3_ENSVE|nr:hypothetical protein OPV22_001580 [Ensete ventricosum]
MSSTEVDSCLRVAERVGLAAVASGSNFVLSPLSIRAALGLAAAGASGETLHQMLSFLGSPTVDHLNSAAARLVASPGFHGVAASVYGAVAKSVDFQGQADEVAKQFISSFDGFKVLKLCYRRNPNQRSVLYMLIFLPDKKDGLPVLIRQLSSDPSFIKHHTPRRDVEISQTWYQICLHEIVYSSQACTTKRGLRLTKKAPQQLQQLQYVLDKCVIVHLWTSQLTIPLCLLSWRRRTRHCCSWGMLLTPLLIDELSHNACMYDMNKVTCFTMQILKQRTTIPIIYLLPMPRK